MGPMKAAGRTLSPNGPAICGAGGQTPRTAAAGAGAFFCLVWPRAPVPTSLTLGALPRPRFSGLRPKVGLTYRAAASPLLVPPREFARELVLRARRVWMGAAPAPERCWGVGNAAGTQNTDERSSSRIASLDGNPRARPYLEAASRMSRRVCANVALAFIRSHRHASPMSARAASECTRNCFVWQGVAARVTHPGLL